MFPRTGTCTLINKSLNGYGDSPSNGFRWKSYIDLAVPHLIDIENAKSSMDVEGPLPYKNY